MRIKIDDELKSICQTILDMDKTEDEWVELESVDMFQGENHCGGFDACERLFTVGKYVNGEELYTIQFTLEQVPMITRGIMQAIQTVDFDD